MTRLCSVTGHGKKRKIKEETVAITDPAARHEAAWMKAEPRREAVPTAKAECGPRKPCLSGNALRTSRHCREGPWRCGPGWRGPGGVRAGRTDESQGRQRAPQHLGWASSPPTPSTCPRSPVTTSGPLIAVGRDKGSPGHNPETGAGTLGPRGRRETEGRRRHRKNST